MAGTIHIQRSQLQPPSSQHSSYVGHRTIRTADAALPQLPFARCTCGWEGPTTPSRSQAVSDGLDHCVEMARS